MRLTNNNPINFVIFLGVLGYAQSAENPELCSTSSCNELSSFIKDSLNTSVNPCDDFYQFTCGGWIAHHKIPEFKSSTGITEELEDVQRERIRNLLENFNVTAEALKVNPAGVAYTAHMYQQCLAQGSESAESGARKLREVIHMILGDDWNILKAEKFGVHGPTWYENFVKTYSFGSLEAIFAISITPDPKNVKSNIISFDPSDFGLNEREMNNLTKNPALVQAYKTYIYENAQLLCDGKCQNASLNYDIDEIVQLESALSSSKRPGEDDRDPGKSYRKITIGQLSTNTQFDWLGKIILPIWKNLGVKGIAVHNDTKVLVSDLGYYVKAIKILNLASPRIVENYFGWTVVNAFSFRASEAFRDLVFEFNKVASGVTKKTERWRSCFSMTLSWAVSRLFIDHYFTEKEKHAASVLIDEVQNSFRHLLSQNTWLDPATVNASISKLNHVTKNVAYPTWILNNTELDKFEGLENRTFVQELLADKNFLRTYVRFASNGDRHDWEELDKPVELDKNWPMSPYVINAAYSPEQNSITIPAGQLKPPFFNTGYPFSVNYGNIGATVGHEFTHGLDDEGRQFDERGNLHNWWSEEAAERFENRSECFVKQYGSQKEKTSGLNLDGKNTLGENIADNGGLNEAFHAYQTHRSKNGESPRLAQLPQYSSEQLFYIAYGNSWCTVMRDKSLKSQIENNVHAPAQYRVNIPVSNSADFAKAFNCPVGSAMNPTKKCHLW